MQHSTRRSVLIVITMMTSFLFCAVAPPEEGVEVRGGAGYSQYNYRTAGGCSGQQYIAEASDVRLHGQLRYRNPDGLTAAADVNLFNTRITGLKSYPNGPEPSDTTDDAVGRTFLSPQVAVRLGFHSNYFGIELGGGIGPLSEIGFYNNDELDLTDGFEDYIPIVSGNLWFGNPKYLYAWASVLSGHVVPGNPLVVGLGIARERFRLSAGLSGVNSLEVVIVEGQYKAFDTLWLGAKLHKGFDSEFNNGATLTFAWAPKL
jgi:hypothetical protein